MGSALVSTFGSKRAHFPIVEGPLLLQRGRRIFIKCSDGLDISPT
jgi:hypothetical protein